MKGEYVSLEKPKSVVQKWALSSPTWPSGRNRFCNYPLLLLTSVQEHFATLTMTFDQSSESTKLTLTLDGVPTGQEDEIKLELWVMQRLLEADIPNVKTSQDWLMFCQNAVKDRNNLFHLIGGLSEIDVFKAWGDEINNKSQWETRILNCLNLVTNNRFKSLTQASLFASIHHRVKEAIDGYEPKKS